MKYIIIVFIALFSVTGAMAQEYKTDVSIRSQVLNGIVPGAQYRDAKSSRPQSTADKQESVGSRIKNNAVPGTPYKKSDKISSGKHNATVAAPASKAVASDKKAEKAQPVAAPELPQNLIQ